MRIYLFEIKTRIFEYFFSRIIKNIIKSEANYKSFNNASDIEKWCQDYNQYFNEIENRISKLEATKEDKFELKSYQYYAGYASEHINLALRGLKDFPYQEIKEMCSTITNSINKQKVKDNVIVVRRLNKIFYKKDKQNTIVDKGFLSTSLNLNYRLDNESKYRPLKNEVLIILKVPKGTNAIYIEKISKRKEFELIIQRNQNIKITKEIRIFNNKIVVGELK